MVHAGGAGLDSNKFVCVLYRYTNTSQYIPYRTCTLYTSALRAHDRTELEVELEELRYVNRDRTEYTRPRDT